MAAEDQPQDAQQARTPSRPGRPAGPRGMLIGLVRGLPDRGDRSGRGQRPVRLAASLTLVSCPAGHQFAARGEKLEDG